MYNVYIIVFEGMYINTYQCVCLHIYIYNLIDLMKPDGYYAYVGRFCIHNNICIRVYICIHLCICAYMI